MGRDKVCKDEEEQEEELTGRAEVGRGRAVREDGGEGTQVL